MGNRLPGLKQKGRRKISNWKAKKRTKPTVGLDHRLRRRMSGRSSWRVGIILGLVGVLLGLAQESRSVAAAAPPADWREQINNLKRGLLYTRVIQLTILAVFCLNHSNTIDFCLLLLLLLQRSPGRIPGSCPSVKKMNQFSTQESPKDLPMTR